MTPLMGGLLSLRPTMWANGAFAKPMGPIKTQRQSAPRGGTPAEHLPQVPPRGPRAAMKDARIRPGCVSIGVLTSKISVWRLALPSVAFAIAERVSFYFTV